MGIKYIEGSLEIIGDLSVEGSYIYARNEIAVGDNNEVTITPEGVSINGSPVITEQTLKALPEYSDDNDGQFLRIIGGEPAWSTVPNAEEATF